MKTEEWRAIADYEGRYEVSDLGRVRSLQYCGKLRVPPLILRPQKCNSGYLVVSLHKDGVQKGKMIHTLVAAAFVGKRPSGFTINHLSGVKTANHASNIEYCSYSDNQRHAFRLGLIYHHGVRSRHVLDDDKIREIDSYLRQGVLNRDIAAFMGVDASCISRVKTRARWSHIR